MKTLLVRLWWLLCFNLMWRITWSEMLNPLSLWDPVKHRWRHWNEKLFSAFQSSWHFVSEIVSKESQKMLIDNYLFKLTIKQKSSIYLWVPVSLVWEFAAFLWCRLLVMEYLWFLDCWTHKTCNFKTSGGSEEDQGGNRTGWRVTPFNTLTHYLGLREICWHFTAWTIHCFNQSGYLIMTQVFVFFLLFFFP